MGQTRLTAEWFGFTRPSRYRRPGLARENLSESRSTIRRPHEKTTMALSLARFADRGREVRLLDPLGSIAFRRTVIRRSRSTWLSAVRPCRSRKQPKKYALTSASVSTLGLLSRFAAAGNDGNRDNSLFQFLRIDQEYDVRLFYVAASISDLEACALFCSRNVLSSHRDAISRRRWGSVIASDR
jgi:hypothetical protein